MGKWNYSSWADETRRSRPIRLREPGHLLRLKLGLESLVIDRTRKVRVLELLLVLLREMVLHRLLHMLVYRLVWKTIRRNRRAGRIGIRLSIIPVGDIKSTTTNDKAVIGFTSLVNCQ